MIRPLGNVQIIPEPIVAGVEHRRKNAVGEVGPVVHARHAVTVPVGSPGSSASTVTGEVGVVPFAAGRPNPNTLAVAALMVMPNSRIVARSVDAVIIDHVTPLIVVFDERCDNE